MLLKQILQRKIELQEEQMIKNKPINYLKGISHFFSAYSLSLSILKKTDPNLKKINRIFEKYLSQSKEDKNKDYNKRLKKLFAFMQENSLIIVQAQKQIQQLNETTYASSDLDKKDAIAISSFEYHD